MTRYDARALRRFLLIAFIPAWALQIGGILSNNRTLYTILVAACMFAPMIAAAAASGGILEPQSGIRWAPLIRRTWKWYLIGWLGFIAVTALEAGFYFLLFLQAYDPAAGYLASLLPAGTSLNGMTVSSYAWVSIGTACLFAPLINMFAAVGEEAGWRGWLIPALRSRFGRNRAMILSGCIWGIWHWPLILLGAYEYGTGYWGFPFTGALAMLAFTTVFGILLSWLYEKSGSIWVPALAHGTLNAVGVSGLYFLKAGTAGWLLGPSVAGLVSLIPAAVIAFFCLKSLKRMDEKEKPSAGATIE